MNHNETNLMTEIKTKIHFIRGFGVMLDSDLAELYGVPVKRLNEQVRRNIDRFPFDFMFQLTVIEAESSRSQNATLNGTGRGSNIKYCPFAFTQEGIAMLSGVIHSETAIKVNIEIMRAFVKMKNAESENKALWQKIDRIEKKYDANFSGVFEAIRELRMGELPNQHGKIKPMGE
jgi:hypothetical protein